MKQFKMTKFDEALITAVKEYPCLYNTKLSNFKVTWKKENSWMEISKRLNSSGKRIFRSYGSARVHTCHYNSGCDW